MKPARYLHFSAFCLDRIEEQLWQGTQLLPLRRKPFAVLRHLVEQRGELVTKDALLTALWPNVHVSEEVLTVHMREVRKVLGDDARTPRFIETVHGRGYRFIAPLSTTPPQGSGVGDQGSVREPRNEVARRPEHAVSAPNPGSRPPSPILVGREAELAQLHQWLDKALDGERQIVFITGEPGIGKTALVEAFLLGIRDWGLGVGTEERQDWRRTGEVASPSGAKFRRPIPNPQPLGCGWGRGNA